MRLCSHSLARIALRHLHGRPIRQDDFEDIEEIVQNVVVRILGFGPERIQKQSWNAFLGRTVHNQAVNYLARQERHRNDPSVDDPPAGLPQTLTDAHLKTLGDTIPSKCDVRKEVSLNEMRKGIAILLETLSEINVRILCLYYEGLKPGRIAKELGMSPRAVSERIFRIKQQVQEWYNRVAEGKVR